MATSTLGSGTLVLAGTTSGTTTVTATAVAGTTTLTLPAATDTLVGKATTDTLTNKTLTTPSVSSPTISDGTANGVAFLNGSKVLTTGSALTFDGSKLVVNTASDDILRLTATAPYLSFYNGATRTGYIRANTSGTFGIVSEDASTPMAFYTAGAEQMRLSISGNLGLGVTPSAWNSIFKVIDTGTTASFAGSSGGANVFNNAYWNGSNYIYKTTAGAARYLQSVNEHLWFNAASGTAGNAITFTQAMTLDASGNLLVGATSRFSGFAADNKFYVESSVGDYICHFRSTQSTPYGPAISFSTAPNNTSSLFIDARDSSAARFQVRSNGGIANYSANNVNLSDERTKTNIQDANGYLAKICAIPVRTFKYKDQTDDLLNLGVIAQEVESVAPELVDISGFGEMPEDGVPLKAIFQTDLQYALMKCIQEQQALITQLTARITALESA